jgi:hypothetical protein
MAATIVAHDNDSADYCKQLQQIGHANARTQDKAI